MKKLILSFALLLTQIASADQACMALSNYVGAYQLVRHTCVNFFGDKLYVDAHHEPRPPYYFNYILTSGPMAVGVSLAPSALDQCLITGTNVMVKTCAGYPCMPQNWSYNFNGNKAVLYADGCVAEFVREL